MKTNPANDQEIERRFLASCGAVTRKHKTTGKLVSLEPLPSQAHEFEPTITPTAAAVQPLKPELEDGPGHPWRAVESGPGMDGVTWYYRIESGPGNWSAVHVERETQGASPGTLMKFKEIAQAVNERAELLAENARLRNALELALAAIHRLKPPQPYDSTQGTRDVIAAALQGQP